MGTSAKFPSRQRESGGASPRESRGSDRWEVRSRSSNWSARQPKTGGEEPSRPTWLESISECRAVLLQLCLLAILNCIMSGQLARAQNSPLSSGGRTTHDLLTNNPTPETDSSFPALSLKQKQGIVHANFERSKSDAAELAALAKELCKDLDQPNVNRLSGELVGRVERIEKLAKRIRDETKGF